MFLRALFILFSLVAYFGGIAFAGVNDQLDDSLGVRIQLPSAMTTIIC